MVAIGCLLSEGDHLYLDRSRDWRAALRLLLGAARAREDAAGAASVVLRDLPDGDDELHDFLLGEGLVRIPVPPSLGARGRLRRRRGVPGRPDRQAPLPPADARCSAWEPEFRVEVLDGGSPAAAALPALVRDDLYGLYREVHARGFELDVFPLPRHLIDAVLEHAGWEIVLLVPARGR